MGAVVEDGAKQVVREAPEGAAEVVTVPQEVQRFSQLVLREVMVIMEEQLHPALHLHTTQAVVAVERDLLPAIKTLPTGLVEYLVWADQTLLLVLP